MIIVETPLKTVTVELADLKGMLKTSTSEESSHYVMGAMAALKWIVAGTGKPSSMASMLK